MVDVYDGSVPSEGFYLLLNPMRGRAEEIRAVGPFDSRDAAKQFHDDERASEPWTDEQWSRSFRPGSILLWMNPLHPGEEEAGGGLFGHGIAEIRYQSVLQRVG